MPIAGLKNLHLTIQLDDQSEDSFEESSDFERSDTLNSTNSEDLRANTIFNSFMEGDSSQENFSTRNIMEENFTVGQKVLCRDCSFDSWREAVVRSLHPIRLSADGSSLKRSFRDIKTVSGTLIGYGEDSFSRTPTPESATLKRNGMRSFLRTDSAGGNVLTTPRNVRFKVVEYSDSQSELDIDSEPSEPTADGVKNHVRELYFCIFE